MSAPAEARWVGTLALTVITLVCLLGLLGAIFTGKGDQPGVPLLGALATMALGGILRRVAQAEREAGGS